MQTPNRQDKYKAIWMSHSGIGDYLKCPRLYYLHNIYKNKNGRKINITSPYMSLGIAVHNVIEDLRNYKSEERLAQPLLANYDLEFDKVRGKKGGFTSAQQEDEFRLRGRTMIENVISDPKMLLSRTIPLTSYYDGDMLPNYYISEEENIILCGNIDWIEYNDTDKSLTVIDFKTGRHEEKEDSMQLPIYKLLLTNLQSKWRVANGKYWYLDSGIVTDKSLDEELLVNVRDMILKIGIEIRDKRYEWSSDAKFGRSGWVERTDVADNFKCSSSSQYCDCRKYEKIITGDLSVEYLGTDMYGKDSYFIN